MNSEEFTPQQIYELRITLRHIRPKIFRTLVVPAATTLRELHLYIQAAFGWYNYHLHAFRDGEGKTYTSAAEGMIAMEMEEDDLDDTKITLDRVLHRVGDRLLYTYDFVDSWEHEIEVLAIGPPRAKALYPAVIDGARNCPPEDCGGPYGYQELVDIIYRQRQGLPLEGEEEERLAWLGDDYDPEAFDFDEINSRLNCYGKLS